MTPSDPVDRAVGFGVLGLHHVVRAGTMRTGLLCSSLLCLGMGCATWGSSPQECRKRADAEYQRCVNPLWLQPDEPAEPTRSDEAQACQAAHRQAIDACGGGAPIAPVPDLGVQTSTRTTTSTRT